MTRHFMLLCCLILLGQFAQAQLFYSTGNGSNGAYTASSNTTLAGGNYNFTDFTIDPGVTVTVTGSAPLIIRCTGNATINGVLQANGGNGGDGVTYSSAGLGGQAVAGGYNGGAGTFSAGSGPITAFDGDGPGGVGNHGMGWSGGGGGGYASNGGTAGPNGGTGGPSNGTIQVTNLPGGSGGGGGSGGYNCGAGGGGAGGGMIAINAGGSISIGAGGSIQTNGGNGGSDGTGNCGGGAGGSGGTIWLAAPSFAHLGTLSSMGGVGGSSMVSGSPYYGTGAAGSEGRIRVDYDGPLVVTGTNLPAIGFHTNIGSIPLPVSIQEFTGYMTGETNSLTWTSSTEINNDYYLLQHSTDGQHFTTIAKVDSRAVSGNSETTLSYQSVHNNPAAGHNYYRLSQVDIDGQMSEYAQVIDVMRDGKGNEMTVYPNPVRDELNWSLYMSQSSVLSIKLMDMSGRMVRNESIEAGKGLFIHSINMTEYPSGVYTLQVSDVKGLNVVKQIRKL